MIKNRAERMRPIVIIGAGITGCVIAHSLAKRGFKIILIEKCSQIGGLTKTFRYGDFSFDIGPHRFYTNKPEISNFIRSVLKGNCNTIIRNTGVYFLGKYYQWPLHPTGILKLPLNIVAKSGLDLLSSKIKNRKKNPINFEDYILENYGPTLYNTFFAEYTHKFLGLSPRRTHFEWAKEGMKRTIIDERIVSRRLADVFKKTFRFKPIRTEFIYPKGGINRFCEKLAEEIRRYGGEILVNSHIRDVKYTPKTIEEIFVNGLSIKPHKMIWTAPLDEIYELLQLPFLEELNYLSLLLYNIAIDRPANKNYQWCYYGNKEVVFSRVSMPNSFDEKMAPKGKTGLCVEVTLRENGQWWHNPNCLVERITRDLIEVGLIDQLSDIISIHIEKVSNAYPIYSLNYQKDLKKVKERLGKYENFVLAGRTGLFWYNNMDDCIENAFEVARKIL